MEIAEIHRSLGGAAIYIYMYMYIYIYMVRQHTVRYTTETICPAVDRPVKYFSANERKHKAKAAPCDLP